MDLLGEADDSVRAGPEGVDDPWLEDAAAGAHVVVVLVYFGLLACEKSMCMNWPS